MRLHTLLLISVCSMLWACDDGRQVPRDAGDAVSPPPSLVTSAEAVARGRKLYEANCAVCHGAGGRGGGPRARILDTKPQDLTEPSWHHEHTAHDLYRTIREGTPGTDMPSWKALEEHQIWDLVAYVRSLERKP